MPVFTTLSVEDEAREKHKYIAEARKKRIVELRRMERERAKEMLSRFKAASAHNAQQQSQFIHDLSLYEQRKRVQQELNEIKLLLKSADANQEAAGVRARTSSAAQSRAANSIEYRRAAVKRGNSALEVIHNQKLTDEVEQARKERHRTQVRDIENLRARQAALITRARNLDRQLALERQQEEQKKVQPYVFVEVTKDSQIPLLANPRKSSARVPNLHIYNDMGADTEQVYSNLQGYNTSSNAFLAAEATKNMASKMMIQREEDKAHADKVVQEELRKTIHKKETEKMADEAMRLLYILGK